MVRRRTKRARIEQNFARALASEVARVGSFSHRAASARLRRLQNLYLPMLPVKSRDALELRRRIAEQVYQHALLRGSSHVVCRAKLKTLSKLGFTDVERKAHFYLLHARAALSRGERRLAHRTAAAMIRELENAPRRSGNPLREELFRMTEALLEELELRHSDGTV
jgi:hypothetical protein